MHMHMRTALLLLVMVTACGCAHTTGSGVGRARAPAAQSGAAMINRLIIDLTPAASTQVEGDPRFDSGALRKAVADGLSSQGLLDFESSAAVQTMAIEVEEFSVRAASNMVMMGRLASVGVLGATVRIRDGSSTELRRFTVRAELPMNIDRTGRSRNPLEALYTGFTRLVADAMAGRSAQPAGQAR
jgi:hypothetical protein